MADLVTMPKLGFDMAEGTLVRWVKAEGEPVEKGELLAEIETDKATVEVESSHSGTVRRHLVSEGDIVPIGDPIAVVAAADEEIDLDALIGAEVEEEPAAAAEREPAAAAAAGSQPSAPVIEQPSTDGAHLPGGVRASPLARRMAAEQGISLRDVTGSGTGGRITKKDILAFKVQPVSALPSGVDLPPVVISEPREDRRIPLSRLRGAIGRRMTESKQQLPHFYVTHDYDMAGIMSMRKQLNGILEPEGIKLSVNDFIVRAAALALRQYPNLNAALAGDHVVQYGHINIGVAVAVESGLLIVVCHDTDFKSLRQISVEVREKAVRVREGKVHTDDIEGSTFTTSNLGMFAVEEFIAIINPPEAAILAIGSVRETPVIVNGEVQAGLRMKATISVDHRVSDGAEAAQFLQAMGRYLEEPLKLLV